MSKDKLTISEIVELMVRSGNTTKKEAEEFVKVFLATIEDALLSGESVKVKGFGTFKSQWNEARRSIDVNTGNEIIIPGFYRVVFQPDADLREVINEPFAHLQTVVLSENAGLDDKSAESDVSGESDEDGLPNQEKADPGLSFFSAQAAEIKEILLDINTLSEKSKQQHSLEPYAQKVTRSSVNQEVSSVGESAEIVGAKNRDVINEHNNEFLDEEAYGFDDESEDYSETEMHDGDSAFDDVEEFDIVREVAVLYADQQLLSTEQTTPADGKTASATSEDNNRLVADSIEKETPEISPSFEDDDEVIEPETEQQRVEVQPVASDADTVVAGEEKACGDDMSIEEPVSQSIDEKPMMPYPDEAASQEAVEEKSKLSVYLIAASLLLITGFAAYFLSPYFMQMRKEKKNQKRLEYIADSLATAKKVQQIKDSISGLQFVKPDTVELPDSLVEPEINLQVSPAIAPERPSAEEKTNENIYSQPRKYSEILATEKIAVGSQLTKLARRYYGHSYFWVYIYEANKDKISNPNNVPLGIEVKIPKVDARLVDPNNKESLNYALKLQSQYLK